MRLRHHESAQQDFYAPVVLGEFPVNEPSMITRDDGTLELYFVTKPESTSISVIKSTDGGRIWSDPEFVLTLPGKAHYGVRALEDDKGNLHFIYHIFGKGNGYRGRVYDIYYQKALEGGGWSEPRKIIPGYVGSLRGWYQMDSGRILVGVGLANPDRLEPPKSGPDYGWNDLVVCYSDDYGETWTRSPDELKFELRTPNNTRYGAIEPAFMEKKDGTLWMLIRDRQGFVMQSESATGERWSEPQETPFISSDSPADILELADGRWVLLLNSSQIWDNPRSYAMGGRNALLAALSPDGGQTWEGFREIQHEHVTGSKRDRGTSIPTMAESSEGAVIVASGQGEENRVIVGFDPDWLCETTFIDSFEQGPVNWTQYGGTGLAVEKDAGKVPFLNIPLQAEVMNGAQINFPMAESGTLQMELYMPDGIKDFNLCLNDHFTRVDDTEAMAHAVFAVPASFLSALPQNQWSRIELSWDESKLSVASGELQPSIDAQRSAQFGINYLAFQAAGTGAIKLRGLQMEVTEKPQLVVVSSKD